MIAAPFHAMGTEIELLVDATTGPAARSTPPRPSSTGSRRCSRASAPDSELSRLNRERLARRGPDLRRVLELALAARERTGGRFDPTVHDALVAAGYDRTFELVPADGRAGRAAAPRRRRRAHRRRRDRARRRASASTSAASARATPPSAPPNCSRRRSCLVNAGGDVAIRGGAGRSASRRPTAADARARPAAALATSGRDRRRWRRGGARAAPPDRPARPARRPRPISCA